MTQTQTVIEGVTPPPAPRRDKEMVRAAVIDYIERKSLSDWGLPDQAATDISEAWHSGMDGYELAKTLESSYHWFGLCFDDVEVLDSIGDVVREAEESARKAWVAEWDIKPPLPIGTLITRGTIVAVNEYMAAAYNVKQTGCTQEGRFLLVKFEDAVPAARESDA